MISPIVENPYAPTPDRTSSGAWISGGGADGQADEILAWMLARVVTLPAVTPQLAPPDLSGRQFDLAEMVAAAVAACGGEITLPASTVQLQAACYRHATTLPVAAARAVKGALVFGSGLLGVTLGIRDRVIVATDVAGVVVVPARAWTWTDAGRIPGARGYRA